MFSSPVSRFQRPDSNSFSQTKKVSKTENTNLYRESIHVVDNASNRQTSMLNSVRFPVVIM